MKVNSLTMLTERQEYHESLYEFLFIYGKIIFQITLGQYMS